MGFKIKKSLLAGTSGHKKATDRQIKINRAIDNSSLPDGRAKSSAFQLVSDKDKSNVETVKGKTTSTSETEDLGGGVSKKTDTSTTPSKTTTTTENKDLTTFKDRCAKYNKKNSAAAKADGCTWKEGVVDPKPDVAVKESSESTKKVSCSCTKPDGGKVNYTAPEGKCVENKPVACTKKPETPPEKTPEPCPNYARHKDRCAKPYNGKKAGVFNETTCRCARDKKLITKLIPKKPDLSKLNIFKKRYKNKCNKSNYGSTLCSNLKSSIKSAMNP
jgi:hypothetical protein